MIQPTPPLLPARRPGRRHGAAAFTLIEVLVVIGILLILIALAVVGFKTVTTSMKTRVTNNQLETCKSLLNDFELTNQVAQLMPVPPVATGHWAASTTPIPAVTPVIYNDNALYCMITATDDDAGLALLKQDTSRVLARLRAVPKNRDTIEKLPPDRILHVPSSPDEPAFAALSVSYKDSNGATQNGTLPTPSVAVPPIVLLDGYGNVNASGTLKGVIYFVPGGGMLGVNQGYKGSGDKHDRNNYDQPGATTTLPGGTIFAPDHRPFWVSPGPDGDLTTGDDNQYSFGN